MSEALVPDVVRAPGLPALVLPTSVDEFEGWSANDVVQWLERVAANFREPRLSIGLGLWVLRERQSEKEYGACVVRLTSLFEVSDDTLLRWRKKAQDHFGLPEPAGAKKRVAGRPPKSEPEDKSSHSANSGVSVPPVTAECGNTPQANARGSEQQDGDGPPKSEGPDPRSNDAPSAVPDPLIEAADLLLKQGADRAADVLGLNRSRDLETWSKRVARRAIQHSAKATVERYRAEEGTKRPARDENPHGELCHAGHHPAARRVGSACMACGKSDAWGK